MITVGTDFSGIGAPEQALKELEIEHEVLFACEKDKYARRTYLTNHSAQIMYEDVTTRDNTTAPSADLYFFGFPCQAFSISGKRQGFDDVRGTLFFNSAQYIKNKRPKVFVAENVKGLLSHDKAAGSKARFGRTFNTIINLLAKTVNGQILMPMYQDNLGYNIYYKVLNSKYYDAPQNRERIFIIGFRDDVNFNFPGSNIISKKLIDILEPVVDEKYFLSDKMIAALIHHTESSKLKGRGFEFKPITDPANEISKCIRANVYKMAPDDNYVLVSREVRTEEAKAVRRDTGTNSFRGKEIIFEPAEIVNTIQTGRTNDNYLLMKEGIRRLTERECMRLQGFPDTFIMPCSGTQSYKQAGNSITVTVMKAILVNVFKALNNSPVK